MARFVRWQNPTPEANGCHLGIFVLANGLGRAGALTPAEHAFWRENNAWYDAAYPHPPAGVYDRKRHPLAASWFRTDQQQLVARIPGYLAILDAHGVPCEQLLSDDPGRVVYSDDFQVVVVPGNVASVNTGTASSHTRIGDPVDH